MQDCKKLNSILIILLLSLESALADPCTTATAVDISNGDLLENGSIIYDDILYDQAHYFIHEANGTSVKYGCICLLKTCIRKCCGTGEAYYGMTCQSSNVTFSTAVYSGKELLLNDADVHIIGFGLECLRYYEDAVFLQKDGRLLEQQVVGSEVYHDLNRYCLEYFATRSTFGATICFPEENNESAEESGVIFIFNAVGLIVSVIFLLITLIVYSLLPELRNLHGKCLMAYVSGLIVGYSLLAYIQLNSGNINISKAFCVTIAFLIYYFFMSSMFWMNAMCFDIWKTFSGFGSRGSDEKRDRRRFIYYSLYSWGIPLLLVGLLILIENHEGIPEYFVKPRFGLVKCWFFDWKGEIVYLYTPMLILVTINVSLFLSTSYKINTIHRETSILKRADSARNDQQKRDKRRFTLYIRLIIVMGVTWSLELISAIIGGNGWYWVVTDCANLLLGIYIFIVFVWKKKVWDLLTKRYKIFRRFRRNDDVSVPGRNAWTTRQSATTEDTRLTSDSHTPMEIQLKDIPNRNSNNVKIT